jgi:uncharacterized protein (UPF0332 family)
MIESSNAFLVKAREALAGAESEYANGRFNNCANRAYYACFLAALQALAQVGIQPLGRRSTHEFVQSQFVAQLVNRRKVYSGELREVLATTLQLRQTADYTAGWVTQRAASRALRMTRTLVDAVQAQAGETP